MAIKFFEEITESSGFDPVPFLSKYVLENDLDTDVIYDVIRVIDSPKGYLVITSLFSDFVFKSSKTYNHLKEAFTVWNSRTGKNAKKGLIGKVIWTGKKTDKPLFQLGIDTDQDAEWSVQNTSTGKKCFVRVLLPSSETSDVKTSNPLLVSG